MPALLYIKPASPPHKCSGGKLHTLQPLPWSVMRLNCWQFSGQVALILSRQRSRLQYISCSSLFLTHSTAQTWCLERESTTGRTTGVEATCRCILYFLYEVDDISSTLLIMPYKSPCWHHCSPLYIALKVRIFCRILWHTVLALSWSPPILSPHTPSNPHPCWRKVSENVPLLSLSS